ncbi:MAG TPA: 2-amino-4-hydroxy-6-hydroxymethyldihydropteridine diphosphokinase [Pedobacter sp.]|jgi:2-amino-4-hydroxy-6-hydroxymethyldihydropteridine diphosphokinase
MHEIYLLLGSNLGNSLDYLKNAAQLIERHIGNINKSSSYYQTAAWGKSNQPDFINQAISLKSSMPAMKLLNAIWSIEDNLDRKRGERWGARTIDIDIIFYGSEIINLPELIIPHKLLHERRFVLMPLNEIAPQFTHPLVGKTINQLLLELTDDLSVKKLEKYN